LWHRERKGDGRNERRRKSGSAKPREVLHERKKPVHFPTFFLTWNQTGGKKKKRGATRRMCAGKRRWEKRGEGHQVHQRHEYLCVAGSAGRNL